MAIDGSRADEVAAALLEYLRGLLDAPDLAFAEPPEAIGRGFDTYIYAFRLQDGAIQQEWARPLVLRLYTSTGQTTKAEQEAAVQRFAAARGYPALDPLAVEREAAAFGLPLMIMDRAPGVPMLERLGMSPFAVARQFARMAELHARLHRLPVDGCPLPAEGPLVERRLAELRGRIARTESDAALDAGLRWLEERKGAVIPEEPSLCHNDFHPLNILVADDGQLTVLDWTDAAVGDRLHDVARTLSLFRFAWIAAQNSVERMVLRLARGFLASRYLGPYRRLYPFDDARLDYWRALQTFWGWLQLVELEQAGPAVEGVRQESVARLPPELLTLVRDDFHRLARG